MCYLNIIFACLLSFPVGAWAQAPQKADGPGPYRLQTFEYPELRDGARNDRRVPIKIHLPRAKGKWPVVVVSHAAGGNWDANYAQATHLASWGYAVLCVEHVGSNTARMKSSLRWLKNSEAMTRDAAEVLNRPKDISFALDQAQRWNRDHPVIKGRFDLDHVGVMGHSFGAYTSLAVLGMRPALDWLTPKVAPGRGLGPDLGDPRIDAGVALSPQGPGEPFFLESSYRSLKRPVLGITGSRDKQQGAKPEHRKKFFELIPRNGSVFLWLKNADHIAFSDASGSGRRSLPSRSRRYVQPIVRAATLYFFEAKLRGDKTASARLSGASLRPLLRGRVSDLQIQKR